MSEIPEHWRLFEETRSTNDSIHEAALAGAPEGTVHIARWQSAGRGRLGRNWWAPPGACLLMSVLLRPRVPATRASAIALVTGAAVRRALNPFLVRHLSLYWPNDLYLGDEMGGVGRKVGGILCELRSRRGPGFWVAVGIGVNVDLSGAGVPPELRDRIASLADAGCRERDSLALALRVVDSLGVLYESFQAGAALGDILGHDLAHAGLPVTVRRGPGDEIGGTVAGVGAAGELLLRDARGIQHEIVCGEVIYEPARSSP